MVGIARLMKPSKAVQLDGTLMRKLCPEDQVRWPPSCLFQSKGGSKDALLAGMVAAPGFSGSSEPVSSLVGVTTRVSIQARECAQFLTVTFGCRLWSDLCKESAFTPYLAKLSATRLEGLGEGNKHVETESNTWLVGLSAGKGFVRLWRIYSKHRKHLQYMACEFTCRSFVDFLHEKGIDVHIGLELNNIKLAFYRGMEGESSNISKVIAHFMESGLDMLIGTGIRTSASSESIDRAVDPDVWLRDVFSTRGACRWWPYKWMTMTTRRMLSPETSGKPGSCWPTSPTTTSSSSATTSRMSLLSSAWPLTESTCVLRISCKPCRWQRLLLGCRDLRIYGSPQSGLKFFRLRSRSLIGRLVTTLR